MVEKQSNNRDNTIDVMRAILLFSIISAHSSIDIMETTGPLSLLIWKIWQIISIVGVPGFYALSGYLYRGKTEPFLYMCKKKMISIVVPWSICGSIIYLITQFPQFSISALGLFLLGYNSYLYYLTVLMLCFLFFYYTYSNTGFLILSVILNLVSLLLAQNGIGLPYLTNFLNLFNWIGYFSIGCLCRKFKIFDRIKDNTGLKIALIILLIAVSMIGVMIGVKSYFYFFSFFIGAVGILGIYSLAEIINKTKSIIWLRIGNIAFSVYLLHMPVVAVIKKVIRHVNVNLYVVIPLLAVLVFWLCFLILNNIVKEQRRKELLYMFLGMR